MSLEKPSMTCLLIINQKSYNVLMIGNPDVWEVLIVLYLYSYVCNDIHCIL